MIMRCAPPADGSSKWALPIASSGWGFATPRDGNSKAPSPSVPPAFFYVARPDARPPLSVVAGIARRHRLPLLVDAAAELPPSGNLRRFIDEGADLVVFSGGKAIGGPMASGILCGRRPLIASALLQQLDLDFEFDSWQPPAALIDKDELKCVPRHGIGRSCKVGKEQIVGLLLALQTFASTPDAERESRSTLITEALLAALRGLPLIETRIIPDAEGRGVPRVEITVAATLDAQVLADRVTRRFSVGTSGYRPRAVGCAPADSYLPIRAAMPRPSPPPSRRCCIVRLLTIIQEHVMVTSA